MSKLRINLRNCSFVVDHKKIREDVDVLIEDGEISEIGKHLSKDDRVIDCKGKVVIPGLINAHTHTPMVLLRGYEDDRELHEWLKRMWKKEKYIKGEITEIGAKLAILEMQSNGIVGAIDMYTAFEVAKVAKKHNFFLMNGPAAISLFRTFAEFEKKMKKFYKIYRNDGLIKPVVNVHSIYTVTEEDIVSAFELAEELKIPVHMHMSETRKEVFDFMKEHGETPIKYFSKKVNLKIAILVHLGWITNWETKYVKKAVFCPSSNMKLATGGFFPIDELRHAIIGLGTDSAASNNDLDLFTEMKIGALKLKDQYWNAKATTAKELFKMATINGYKLMKINGGIVEEGKIANLAIVETKKPTLRINLYSNIVYSHPKVLYTIANGKVVYNYKKPPKFNFADKAINKIYKK